MNQHRDDSNNEVVVDQSVVYGIHMPREDAVTPDVDKQELPKP